MAFTLVLTKNGAVTYTFEFTPMVAINYDFQYNKSASPVKVSGVLETWLVTDAVMLESDPTQLATDWAELINFIGERDDDVISIALKSGSTTLHEINTTTHYKFMITNVRQSPSRGLHVNHIPFSFTITAMKGLPGTETGGGGEGDEEAEVTAFEQTLSFSYDQGGFLTKSLRGIVRTQGTGSAAAARAMGYFPLPDDTYVYLTNGPEGVNIEVKSTPADDEATFECIAQQQALAYPNTNVYRYLKTEKVQRTRYADYIVVNVLAQASSLAVARAACLRQKPDNCEGYDIEEVHESNTASYTFYAKTSRKSHLSKSYEYQIVGGGKPTVVVETLYGPPLLGKGPEQPTIVEEELRIRAYRDSPDLLATPPPLLLPVDEDVTARRFSLSRVAESPNDAKFDEYEARTSRRYVVRAGERALITGKMTTTIAAL